MSQATDRPRLGMRTSSGWVIGRVGGVPVVLAPSWLLIAAVLVLLYYPVVSSYVPRAPTGTVVLTTLAFVVMLFVSVLVHELAHGLTAAPLGARAREYVVTFWGGHTAFDRELPGPGSSALVSIAGPAANAALAGLAWLVLETVGLDRLDITAWLVLFAAVIANGIVAAFNLLPGLPLDGGRVLESLVWKITGDRARGTVVAAWGGRVVVIGVLLWFLVVPMLRGGRPDLTSVIWVVLLGSFLWAGASQALRGAGMQRAAAAVDLRSLAVPTVVLDATASLAAADTVLSGGGAAVVLVHAGRPVAMLDPSAVAAVPPEHRATTSLGSVARTLAPEQVVAPLTGPSAVAAVAKAQRHGPAVVLHDGVQVLGVVEVAAVARAMGIRGT
ncbi:site-2 protease family protein [Georgenia subflava]|uniref:Peptidase M50 n=1 Tax=Georgenia subflava TaxID=1622177 RepID=A0A6N7EFJ4_9MICO|nr:site-2 protease family protein [Georgenia subflava]MPV35718.1 peptidase M50 [Georgenia subflava]